MAKAVLFDLDGVIVDTENTVWSYSSEQLMNRYNIMHDDDKIKHLLMGCRFEDGTKLLHEYYDIPDSFENFLQHRRDLVRKGFAENVAFMEGFEAFHKKIKHRAKAVATSMDDEFLQLTMGHLPLSSFFGEHIYPISQVGGRGKPHPDIFLYAAEKLGKSPETCIVIEDAPKGVAAGKAAGMTTIALTTSVSRTHLTHADYIVDSFAEITDAMLL